jgi:trehalose-6-phosphate synthase
MPIFCMPARVGTWRATPTCTAWDEPALRALVAAKLPREQVIVVSDRQPFSHVRVEGQLHVTLPASGLVTAVEPIVRACAGSWVAHGSGSADGEVVDELSACQAPASMGGYRLRRVWLSDDDTRGYRDGFSNSGLWPLCHLVHVRPKFLEADWRRYQQVNRRFAQAVIDEARQPDPVVLVHDYHLALVPALLRQRLPRATIVSFWHIPWTAPEQMAICPWLPALMQGLLASDIVGLQTAQHRKNFLATAESCGQEVGVTQARDYPISVAWPAALHSPGSSSTSAAPAWRGAMQRWSVPLGGKLIVGIDRFDYTKGLVERLHAVEHLLATQPEWRGRLRFVQVAAPSRSTLPDYAAFRAEVLVEVRRINARFSTAEWEPIQLLDAHHDRPAVQALYKAAHLCLVSSLHDGMNLVCKEFVVSRDDEQGVLVLSQFAGAAAELRSALIVNPYHTEQVAAALHRGLVMSAAEQRQRMRALRATVKQHNVYRWAAHMLLDAADLRDARTTEQPMTLSPRAAVTG